MSYLGPQQAVAIPSRRSSDDAATLALVAIVVMLVAGAAGWMVARESAPTWADVESTSRIAANEAALDGRSKGFGQGAKAGRREARIESRYESLRAAETARTQGWQNGYFDGQDRALAQRDGFAPFGGGSSAYPSTGIEDLSLSAETLFDDVPGYADSSVYRFDAPGYRAPLSGSLADYYRGGSR